MVNSAGGLRFNQPSQDLTHIVMGEPDQGVKVFLEKATHRLVLIDTFFIHLLLKKEHL